MVPHARRGGCHGVFHCSKKMWKMVENPLGSPVGKWSVVVFHIQLLVYGMVFMCIYSFSNMLGLIRWDEEHIFGICHVKSALKPPTSSVVFGSCQSYFLPPAPSCHLEGLECSNLVSISPHLCHGPALNHGHVRWLKPKKGQYHIVQLVLSISTT